MWYKFMKKFLVLFFCLLLGGSVGAESIKDARFYTKDTHLKKFNEENFPVMFKYFRDYAESFLYKYDITKDPPPGYVNSALYYVQKDGIVFFRYPIEEFKKIDKRRYRFKRYVVDNPPPPFPEGMEDGAIMVHLSIENDKYEEGNKIVIIANSDPEGWDSIDLGICKNKENMHMGKRKCKKLGCKWDEEGRFCRLKYSVKLNHFDD